MEKLPKQIRAVGIPWYNEADYDTLRAAFIDGGTLAPTFLQWQDQAEQVRKRNVREGKTVVKAHIDLDRFRTWCAANGYQLDSRGRGEFAAAEARRVVTEMNHQS